MRPDLKRVPEAFHNYINQVKEDDLLPAIKKNTKSMLSFFDRIPKKKREHRYAEGKWSIKELLLHLIDAERIFSYRALRFARKDATPLPGFDENIYVTNAKIDNRTWKDLIREFKAVRNSTELLFESFDEDQLEAGGVSTSGHSNYVRAFGFIVAGHCNHHRRVIKERYL